MKKVIPLMIVAAFLLSGCGDSDKTSISNSKSQTDSQQNEVYIMAGKVEAQEQAAVTTKLAGKVAKINVDVGSQVKHGDIIVELDTTDVQTQVQQSEAAVATAQANLDNIKAGSRPEQIAQAQATFESAKKNYEMIKNNFERVQSQYTDIAVTQQEFDVAQNALASAEAQYQSAESQLEILKQGATKQAVNVVDMQLMQSKAALEVSKALLSNSTIIAPVSGTVVSKNINVGELATAGLALVTIVNSDKLYVDAYLPEVMIEQVKQGQQVFVKVGQLSNKKYDGEISLVNSAVNQQSKNVTVRVEIKNPDPSLKSGMFAEIGIKK